MAKELKNQTFDFIFCSDFGFRRTTADLIVEEMSYKESKIIVDENLREKDADICNHITRENLRVSQDPHPESSQIISRLFIKTESVPADVRGSETTEEVLKRALAFLSDLVHNYPSDARILVVGNPIINSFIIANIKGEKEFTKYIASPCSLSLYEKRGERRIEKIFNHRDHLYVKP